jgi:MoaA/NifB/PqqE/SkfB family radical SAM enzyme
MESFIAAGGHAEWDFIVFRHNEHQVEEARKLSKQMGFKAFHVKKTGRFFSNSKVQVTDSQEVHDQNGNVEYHLQQPLDPKYLNSALERESEIVARFGTMKRFFAQTPIDCRVAREKSIYVSAEGLIFPCCWTANQLYPWYYKAKAAPIWKMLEALPLGVDSLSALKNPIKEIVEGGFFQRDLPNNWNKKGEPGTRLFVCEKTCGKGFDAFTAQFEAARPSQEMSL